MSERTSQKDFRKIDEHTKTAALEILVSSELKQHLATNRARLITYEQVPSEIQAYIEARRSQFAFKTGAGKNTSDPMDVDSFGKRKAARKGKVMARRARKKAIVQRLTMSAPLDVGALRRGTGTCQVRKPKVPEWGSDVIVRESPDELTLRAEEVNTSKGFDKMSTTLKKKDGVLPWLILTGMPSAMHCTKARRRLGNV